MNVYNKKSFKFLNTVESIRLNTGMYIGSTENPNQLFEEIFDNALDECIAGFSDEIIVEIDQKKNIYSISDNGRGIPIDDDLPIKISTVLHSGSKFKNNKSGYEITTGLHGLGLPVVNALSNYFKIETINKNNYYSCEFNNFELVNKYYKKIPLNEKKFSTKISFIPDKDIFKNVYIDIEFIKYRILFSSINLDKCIFKLIYNDIEKIIKITQNELLQKFVISNKDEHSEIIDINIENKKNEIIENLNVKLCYSLNGKITPKILSSVNLLNINNGTHIKLFINSLKNIFTSFDKRNKLFLSNDVIVGLRAYINLIIKEPEFGGQNKKQLINRVEYLEDLFIKFEKKLIKYLIENENILNVIICRFSEYRRKINSKNINKNIYKKRILTKYSKLKDCRYKNGELFLVEGDSAAGSLIQARDSNIHAIMPLKGKIPNVINKKQNIIKNNEVQEIISALGTGINQNFDLSKLRYDKIIITTDADPDGQHITTLLIVLFAYLVPEIIKENHLFVCKTPLYAINNDNIFIPIWNDDDLYKARHGKYANDIILFKGLGEINPIQLKTCVFDESRKLICVSYTNDLNEIIKLLSNSDDKRKLLNFDVSQI